MRNDINTGLNITFRNINVDKERVRQLLLKFGKHKNISKKEISELEEMKDYYLNLKKEGTLIGDIQYIFTELQPKKESEDVSRFYIKGVVDRDISRIFNFLGDSHKGKVFRNQNIRK